MIRVRRSWAVAAVAVAFWMGGGAGSVLAQPGRRATTLESIDRHPVFFHREGVVLLADAVADGVLTWLVSDEDDHRLLVLDVPTPAPGIRERLEIVGTFYDVGRLEENDPRLSGLPITRISEQLLRKRWPGVGELPLIVATSSRPAATDREATTLRTIVLEPERYVATGVTVTGRFRGRNLYGDMPEAPEASRWDFVLRSADAAVWIVGKEPKGDGFELDVTARVDTNKWLEVTGTVRVEDGMSLIEAGALTLATPEPARQPTTTTDLRRAPSPPPEVIFSAPLPDDVNTAPDGTVRIQFSRDMTPDSFEGRVQVRYASAQSATAAADEPPIAFELFYRRRNRALEIRFADELEPFRRVIVELADGITASDGSALRPWNLSFRVGGA